MTLLQADLYGRRVHGRIDGVDRGETGVDSDIRDEHAEIIGLDGTSNKSLERRNIFLGFFQTRAGR
jgi:hypothetical protein